MYLLDILTRDSLDTQLLQTTIEDRYLLQTLPLYGRYCGIYTCVLMLAEWGNWTWDWGIIDIVVNIQLWAPVCSNIEPPIYRDDAHINSYEHTCTCTHISVKMVQGYQF